jgi:Polyketide cyclase / dehydrase and lipid transport
MMGPIRVEIISHNTTYERPHRLHAIATTTIGALPVMYVQGSQTFDSVPEGTRIRWLLEVEPRGVFKLMTPQLAGGLGQRLDTTFANLKRLLETQQIVLPRA